MTGAKGRGKKGQRPEIEAQYDYDVKAAMQTLRLLYECKELVSEGHIILPRPERDFLIHVRTGNYSIDKVLAMAQKLLSECEEAARLSFAGKSGSGSGVPSFRRLLPRSLDERARAMMKLDR
jgi:hypothetical protein